MVDKQPEIPFSLSGQEGASRMPTSHHGRFAVIESMVRQDKSNSARSALCTNARPA